MTPKRSLDARRMPLVVGRTPLLPLSAVTGVFSAPEPLAALRNLLESTPLVRQALYVASPSLADAVDAWLRGEKLRNADTPLRALAYVARMAARPTPFGLCAGIGTVDVGENTTLAVDEDGRRTHTRPDMGLIADVMASIESSESKRSVSYVANRAAIERGGRLYVTHVKLANYEASGAEQRPVSLKNTAAVQLVRELAERPQRYDALAGALAERYDAPVEEAERLLERLIEAGVIISELCVSPVGDPIGYTCERVRAVDAQTALALDAALEAAGQLDATPLTQRTVQSYQAAIERFSALSEKPPEHAVQIDMESPFSGTFGAAILEDAERLADYWVRLAPVLTLKRLRERFQERYEGNERMVPLLELVDPNIGLGVPDAAERQEVNDGARDAALMRIACEAARNASEEAELSEADIELIVPPLKQNTASGLTSAEVGFHIAARSSDAIGRGEYLLVPGGLVASSRATRSLGRFGHLFDEPARERMRAVAREDGCESDGLTAELVYAPSTARMYNVAMRPRIFDTEIRVGIGGPPAQDEIAPDDLWVGLKDDRFFLWSQSRQRRILPRESHVFNTDKNAPNLCRFLAALEFEGQRAIIGFDWGAAGSMTYLPRIRIGRIVLSERRWLFGVKELGKSAQDASNAIERWRALWAMPRYVYLANVDNRLLIDLDSPIAAQLIFDQRPDGRTLTFVEALPSPDDVWTNGPGGAYAVEFVVSLLARERAPLAPGIAATPQTIVQRRRFGLGSEWTYVKLYMGDQAIDDFLTRAVLPLTSELRAQGCIDRWFFVRYGDPQSHVRLRVRAASGHAASVRERIVAASEEWLREERVQRCAFDTYDPEYERYGGPRELDAAERFFTLDSEVCAEQLSGTRDTSDARVAAAVESFAGWLCRDGLGELALEAFKSVAKRKLDGADREQLKRIAALDFEASDAALEEALAGADREDRLRSLFHMHCNRAGVNMEYELRAVALLRAVVMSRNARLARLAPSAV
jgi:lantibiotic biosynthesis protein